MDCRDKCLIKGLDCIARIHARAQDYKDELENRLRIYGTTDL